MELEQLALEAFLHGQAEAEAVAMRAQIDR